MDMLSELPSDIILKILTLVPIENAVLTSLLSRQWRYAWTSLPRLDFQNDRSLEDDSMVDLITHVLSLHKGPIQSFRLSYPFNTIRYFGFWLHQLARNDVQELVIDMDCSPFRVNQYLHSSLYDCGNLTKLELYNCRLEPPPVDFEAFLFLRRLVLHKMRLLNCEVKDLVAKSPCLEELEVKDCNLTELRFSALNLKVLRLHDQIVQFYVDAPLLTELSVKFGVDAFFTSHRKKKNSVCNYTNVLGGFENLEKLCGERFFRMYLSRGIESCHRTLVFRCLTDIRLTFVDFEDVKDVSVVARLVLGAPNLENLELSHATHDRFTSYNEPKVKHVWFNDFGCTPDFKLEKLNAVTMVNIDGLPPQVDFVRFLLERSPALRTMTFRGVFRRNRKLIAGFKGCRKASPNVKLAIFTTKRRMLCDSKFF